MNIKTTDLCDACEDAQVCELPFMGFGKKLGFSGDIRTVRYVDGLGVLRELINQSGHGQVLVIDGADLKQRALFGDIMAGLAIHNGWAGIIVNGLIRDRKEIDDMNIGVKALGTTPRRADLGMSGQLDVPVQFGSVTFTPGARLIADEDGIIVLPAGLTESNINLHAAAVVTAAYVTRDDS